MLKFEMVRSVRIGTGLHHRIQFQQALDSMGCVTLGSLFYFLSSYVLVPASVESKLDVALIRAGELGFRRGENAYAVTTRAQERGLLLCPPECGVQFRLQYLDQPKGERVIVGMEPMLDRKCEDYCQFQLGHGDEGLWLYLYVVASFEYEVENRCSGDDLWAFVLPKG